MSEYKCGICKKVKECDEDVPEISEEEIFICPSCEEVIHRLTGLVINEEEEDIV